MFGGGKKESKSVRIETLIGAGTEFVGDVIFSGGMHLDGRIKGNIVAEDGTDSVCVISETGVVEGEIRVPNIALNGTVVGDVYASEKVELQKHAKVHGNVYYNMLEMAMGAEINGNMVHSKGAEPKIQLSGPNEESFAS